jgi:thiosulfate dehydrogenase
LYCSWFRWYYVWRILKESKHPEKFAIVNEPPADCWTGAGANQIPVTEEGKLIRYGRNLIENTAQYLGPKGTVAQISNGMNCQNCHLEAGTKPWGNNYGAVASTYPKFRERSGSIETIEKRVNDCFERSLNGKPIDNNSKEMRAIIAYIKWLGNEVPKGVNQKVRALWNYLIFQEPPIPRKGKNDLYNYLRKMPW